MSAQGSDQEDRGLRCEVRSTGALVTGGETQDQKMAPGNSEAYVDRWCLGAWWTLAESQILIVP